MYLLEFSVILSSKVRVALSAPTFLSAFYMVGMGV